MAPGRSYKPGREGRGNMGAGDDWVGRITDDIIVALGFYTRLPVRHDGANSGEDLARASWAAPLAGAVVGAFGALAYALAHAAGLGPLPAAGLAPGAPPLGT